MRNAMLGMLGALMFVLAACAKVVPVQDFDLEKMAGKWYIVGLASNAKWFVNNKAVMETSTAMLEPTGGDLNLTYANLNADGSCWRTTQLANKTDTPGHFSFHSQLWNNDNEMLIVEVAYNEYALVYTDKTQESVSEVLTQLYSRTTEVTLVLQQKFIQFSLENGAHADNVLILPHNGECPQV